MLGFWLGAYIYESAFGTQRKSLTPTGRPTDRQTDGQTDRQQTASLCSIKHRTQSINRINNDTQCVNLLTGIPPTLERRIGEQTDRQTNKRTRFLEIGNKSRVLALRNDEIIKSRS